MQQKNIILILLFCFLSCFYIQKKIGLLKVKPLYGVKVMACKPTFSLKSYFNSSYQDSLNTYLNENVGFRPMLIRLINQLNFSLFSMTKAPGVIIGKNGMLYIESYIDDYTGKNFVGRAKADELVKKIKQVQDSLKEHDIDLLIVFAPGKASYYPEYIPDKYIGKKKDSTNYKYYSAALKKNNINFIDFNSYYRKKYESNSPYAIYPEYGTHWTPYGAAIAMDSIAKYIERKRNIILPKFDYRNIILRDSLAEKEYDIGILLNLQKTLPHLPMPYPKYVYTDIPNQNKPDVLVVGDSYWWCMVGEDMPSHFFKEDEYWFYNKDIYKHNSKIGQVSGINFANEISKRDVIILMATEATFYMFPYGFIDKAYSLLCFSDNEKREMISKQIEGDENWKSNMEKKARQNNVSYEDQKKMDIQYVIKSDYSMKKKTAKVNPPMQIDAEQESTSKIENSLSETSQVITNNDIVKEYAQKIKASRTWYTQVQKNATKKKVSVEKQLVDEALYAYHQEYGTPEIQRELNQIKNNIKNTPDWYKSVLQKAKQKHISIDDMLEIDAKYVYDTSVRPKK